MSVFSDIVDQHLKAAQIFEQAAIDATALNDIPALEIAIAESAHNDQAYFLYLFTRLEDVINDHFKNLVDTRSSGSWDNARPWAHFKQQNTQDIALLTKASMLTPKGNRDWNRIQDYYKERNSIGHGNNWAQSLVISQVGQDMQDIVSRFVDR